eukprot:TRINITY_DN1421_c0_g1_i1.p1 TRINITY_DN1421_c0_g1~~TRINITY_DN1421_c0_g1_i1.p1  ORF type:complete len:1578 (-),score=400.60 TRINITY_DN1421_c0_g1_i1:5551-10284(-)
MFELRLDELGRACALLHTREGVVLRLPRFLEVIFVLPADSEIGQAAMGRSRIVLVTNAPHEGSPQEFLRNRRFEILPIHAGEVGKEGLEDLRFSVTFTKSGSFYFYFSLENGHVRTGTQEFVTMPVLSCAGTPISLRNLHVQTVITKLLGPLSTWKDQFQHHVSNLRYNCVHFTPLEQRGESGSAYSIQDQLSMDESLSEGEFDAEEDVDTRVRKMIEALENELGLLSMSDVVWNHTASSSKWIRTHSECGYNMVNSPHLMPAYDLDAALQKFERDLISGRYKGLMPHSLQSREDVVQIVNFFERNILPTLNLLQYVDIDVDAFMKRYAARTNRSYGDVSQKESKSSKSSEENASTSIFQSVEHLKRFIENECIIHEIPLQFDEEKLGSFMLDMDMLEKAIQSCIASLKKGLETDLSIAMQSEIGAITYEKVVCNRPEISKKSYLFRRYFVELPGGCAEKALAVNGWVIGQSPLEDFACEKFRTYLRRELVSWGDCIKLRYGADPSDCPYLWQRMEQYTRKVARLFHGIRIDNAHGTPMHVCQYMVDCAREERSELFIMAELFTGSEDLDRVYTTRVGLTYLIREAMQAPDLKNLCHLVHHFGGQLAPVGAFMRGPAIPSAIDLLGYLGCDEEKMHGIGEKSPVSIRASFPEALFFDATHDNDLPTTKRTPEDTLSNAAIVAMARSSTGSVRGYDEIYRHKVDLVKCNTKYPSHNTSDAVMIPPMNALRRGVMQEVGTRGIMLAKAALNQLHSHLDEKFTEIHIDQKSEDVVSFLRFDPLRSIGYLMVCRSSFQKTSHLPEYIDVSFPGVVRHPVFSASVEVPPPKIKEEREENLDTLESKVTVRFKEDVLHAMGGHMELLESETGPRLRTTMRLYDFNPGTVVVAAVRLEQNAQEASAFLISKFLLPNDGFQFTRGPLPPVEAQACLHAEPFEKCHGTMVHAFGRLSMIDLNYVLFRSHEEEMETCSRGVYEIPGIMDKIKFCGLIGIAMAFDDARQSQDLGNPLCENIRQGFWLVEYIRDRFVVSVPKGLSKDLFEDIAKYLTLCLEVLRHLPKFLRPRFVDFIVRDMTRIALVACAMTFPRDALESDFRWRLSLGMLQFYGLGGDFQPSLCAGMPHFCAGFMRRWGRDTGLSLAGLLALGMNDEVRKIILDLGSYTHNGLIPNLILGDKSRYNARDAVWWFLMAVQEYATHVPGGERILKERVTGRFEKREGLLLQDLIHEILMHHVNGIQFRERNAGKEIDEKMTDEGFNVEIFVDTPHFRQQCMSKRYDSPMAKRVISMCREATYFCYGGNQWNCGTWMDKMGESKRAKNFGVPSTPRDGAAIEITALLHSTLVWLIGLHRQRKYDYDSVEVYGKTMSYQSWAKGIEESFDMCYYVPYDPLEEKTHVINPKLVNHRGIYKDVFCSSAEYTDYQLRPNAFVALSVSPSLLIDKHFQSHMKESSILVPSDSRVIGIRTLDAGDWAYHGIYQNSEDSDDPSTALGANYHQGPEWVWCTGYYLSCMWPLARRRHQYLPILTSLRNEVMRSPWMGLPELTNMSGTICWDGCPSQAWSVARILDFLWLVRRNKESKSI